MNGTVISTIFLVLAGLLALGGLTLTLLSLPGVWLIFLSAVIIAILGGFETITGLTLLILFFICIFSTIVDNLLLTLVSKKSGASNYGALGALIGGMLGLLIANIPGMLIGPFVGAVLAEYLLAKKSFNQSIKSGWASFVGFLLGTGLKILINIGLIIFIASKAL